MWADSRYLVRDSGIITRILWSGYIMKMNRSGHVFALKTSFVATA